MDKKKQMLGVSAPHRRKKEVYDNVGRQQTTKEKSVRTTDIHLFFWANAPDHKG